MSTIQNAVRIAILAKIKDEWKDDRNKPRTKVLWPNQSLSKIGRPIDRDIGWIAITIQFGATAISTKNGRNTMAGTLLVQFFIPRNKGGPELYIKGDHMRDMFNRVQFSGIRFDSPGGVFQTQDEDSGWLEGTMDIPFTADETGVVGTIE